MHKPESFLANAGLLRDFVKFKSNLKRLLARIVERQDIDDLLQETYIRVCFAAEKTDITNAKSFLLKTAQNLAFNHVASAYQRRVQLEDFSSSDFEPLTPDFESQFESKEKFLAFCSALRELPPQCRKAFVLRKVYGLSQQEIAAALAISESTVEKHVAKGLQLCREAMLRMGHMESGLKQGEMKQGGAKHAKQ
ncbi:MAG: RNA polymerase sigma factor [Pseudomonadales bacterium]|jgi:RNA polymerase sigma-70 factor (ECF subfamily)|nr:RNA polymerase sigma factor [Pseudomonadales bacterium]